MVAIMGMVSVVMFQFSTGDAGSYGILNVRVFKFFVCVLAWWCLAGLCGFPGLVCRYSVLGV